MISKSADEEISKLKEESKKLDKTLTCKEVELLTLKEEVEAIKEEATEDKKTLQAAEASLKAVVERQREEAEETRDKVDSLKSQLALAISGAADSVEATTSTYISIARRHCLLLGVSLVVVRRLHEFVDPDKLPADLGEEYLDPHNPGESDDEAGLQTDLFRLNYKANSLQAPPSALLHFFLIPQKLKFFRPVPIRAKLLEDLGSFLLFYFFFTF